MFSLTVLFTVFRQLGCNKQPYIYLCSILGNPGVIHSVPTAFLQWVRNGSRLGYRGCLLVVIGLSVETYVLNTGPVDRLASVKLLMKQTQDAYPSVKL